MKVDIHHYKNRVEHLERQLESLDIINKKDVLDFEKQISAEGLSAGRIMKYLYSLRTMALMMKKPFRRATKKDIIDLIGQVEKNEKWSEWTKRDFKILLKRFYKWLRNTDESPPEVKWIKADVKVN
jgi:hypothetical protein